MSSIYTLVFAEVAAFAFSMYWRSGSGSRSTATRSIGRGSRMIQVDYMRRENLSVKVLDFVQSGWGHPDGCGNRLRRRFRPCSWQSERGSQI